MLAGSLSKRWRRAFPRRRTTRAGRRSCRLGRLFWRRLFPSIAIGAIVVYNLAQRRYRRYPEILALHEWIFWPIIVTWGVIPLLVVIGVPLLLQLVAIFAGMGIAAYAAFVKFPPRIEAANDDIRRRRYVPPPRRDLGGLAGAIDGAARRQDRRGRLDRKARHNRLPGGNTPQNSAGMIALKYHLVALHAHAIGIDLAVQRGSAVTPERRAVHHSQRLWLQLGERRERGDQGIVGAQQQAEGEAGDQGALRIEGRQPPDPGAG